MKTLWQQMIDFARLLWQSLSEASMTLADPLARDEKVKRKHPLTDEGPRKMERFTQRARRVLGLAQEAAERLQHASIRPEHLLLGLIHEVDGMAGSVLKELNVDLKQAEALVVTLSDPEKRKIGANLKLSENTKIVLELSVDEARRMGHHYIGTEHLLLALVRPDDSVSIQVLKTLGITPADVRQRMHQALQDMSPKLEEASAQERQVDIFTSLARQVLTTAQKEAERLQHQQIGTEHILLSLLIQPEGIAAHILSEYKFEFQKVEVLVTRLTEAEKRKPDTPVALSSQTMKLLELTVQEALQLRDLDIGPEHLLLGITRYEGCAALRILRELGVDTDELRIKTLKAIEE